MREGLPAGPLTILFSDVEGSTDLRTRRGDAAAHRVLRSHEELVRACVGKHGGREIKALGDGFMIAFVSARNALTCAIDLQQSLRDRNLSSPGEQVQVRIGINTGEVVLEGDDIYGQAVNAAARIAARARGGEILVSEIVRQLAGSGPEFTFTDRGRFRLKGFPDRWHLFGVSYATGDVPAGVVPFGDRTPFVGREAERADLRRLLDRAAAGEGGLVLIGGEPGVGKTRLAEELAGEARTRFRVVVGHSYESGRDLPYMPWVEMLESTVAETAPEDLRRLFGDEAPELARLVPELRRVLPDIPLPVEVPAEQQRRFTFNSIRDFVTRVSRIQPRLYVLEDLHWADEPTLSLLEHLAERLPGIPCLVLGTYRDNPADVSPQLAGALSRLVRLRQVRRLGVARHSEAEVRTLLRALSGQAPPQGVWAEIYSETEGNAYFVEEVFRHFAESGRLLDEAGHFREGIGIGELEVPANVRLVIGQRLERLDVATQQTLAIAAVTGRHIGFDLLEAIADVGGDELIDALDSAERAGLIVTETSGEQEEYWFAHELTRQTLLTRLPAARRRRHHLRIADAMERVYAADLAGQAGTISQHLIEAGSAADPAKLAHCLVLAGKRSLESAAFEDALRHLHRAYALIDHMAPEERAEMLFLLGMAERGVGNWGGAIGPLRRAIEVCATLGDIDAVSRSCVVAAYSLAWAARFADGHELAQRSLAILGDRRNADYARLLTTSGFCIASCGQYEQGLGEVGRALAIAEELGDPDVLAFVLLWKAILHMAYMEMADSVADCRRAAALPRQASEVWQYASVIGIMCENLLNLGGFDEARRIRDELLPLAERIGNSGGLWNCLLVEGTVRFCETGDPGALEDLGRRAIELCEQAGLGWASWGWTWRAGAQFLGGNWEVAISYAERAESLALPSTFAGCEWALHFEYLAYAGRRDEALSMLAARRADLPRPGGPGGWGPWLMLLSAVEGLAVLGERAEAAGLYPAVRHCIERTGVVNANPADAKLPQRIAGMAAAAGGLWDAAEAHFRRALEQAETQPHRPEQAHTRRFYAAMLLDRGGPGDAAEALRLGRAAADLYRVMGMPRHVALAEALRA